RAPRIGSSEVEPAGRRASVALMLLLDPLAAPEVRTAVEELDTLHRQAAGAGQPVGARWDQLQELVGPAGQPRRHEPIALRDQPAARRPVVLVVQPLREAAGP